MDTISIGRVRSPWSVARQSSQPKSFIAIGIDFGTTYSGVSYALSSSPDAIEEIQEWPSSYDSQRNQAQVPTQYDIQSGRWGYEITHDMHPAKWFKLLLLREDDDILSEDIRDSPHLKDARELLRRHGVTAVEVVGKYLGKLWRHAYRQIQTRLDPDSFPLRVAITVPAIWPPYAHKAMRDAAKAAGILADRDMGVPTLDLIQEPEAAGLSTLSERGELPEVKIGETFIVVDAGGGTVDIISYTIESTRPLKLKECVRGDGNLSGAFLIDEAFENHLRWKTKLRIKALQVNDYNAFVDEQWEMGAKRSFTGTEKQPQFTLNLPAKAYKTRDRLLRKDSFSLSREEMRGFFSPSHTGIRDLISSQIKEVTESTRKGPTNILLVGGLGASPYIYNVLQKQYKRIVLRPRRSWSAVARGAVLRLLHDEISRRGARTLNHLQLRSLESLPHVTSRKSRFSYGIVVHYETDILEDYDPKLDTKKTFSDGVQYTPRMEWYLTKGEEIKTRSPRCCKHTTEKRSATTKCVYNIYYSSADVPPKRYSQFTPRLCHIECDWDIPFEEWEAVGDPRIGLKRYDGITLAMTFEGEPKWTMRVGRNRAEHSVRVEYMEK